MPDEGKMAASPTNFQSVSMDDISKALNGQAEKENSQETHPTSDKIYKFMLAGIVALNIVDAAITLAGFKATEGTAFYMSEWGLGMSQLIPMLGIEGAMLFKAVIASGVLAGVTETSKNVLNKYLEPRGFEKPFSQNIASLGLAFVNSAYIAVVISNIYQISKVV